MNFNDLNWHDAIVNKIVVDRYDPGNNDILLIDITWPNGVSNNLIFEDVYWTRMSMNFGVVATESIRTAEITETNDIDLISFYSKWKGLIDTPFNCYLINTNSTNSEIKIISKSFKIIDSNQKVPPSGR